MKGKVVSKSSNRYRKPIILKAHSKRHARNVYKRPNTSINDMPSANQVIHEPTNHVHNNHKIVRPVSISDSDFLKRNVQYTNKEMPEDVEQEIRQAIQILKS